ncbi:NADPH-dependent FMN reductase [Frankia canadensis]|uniref:NADPH-dependent FMN reductase n=1 Tax=Frankia canadensis TaxID=1836972 RepID=A0A2I2KSC6_9ACTN|nr:NAD(P)H-dependent oxidoreductase [Frankia canadensis]SNQ48574.1 NADPH-dependent FMN reductase [Frankia canadensis]SOU55864.1 NADPH-dependent FMN reductase [Frankia canadensis]
MKAVAVVGNPRPASRTADAAQILARALGSESVELIELAELGAGLLGWGDPAVAEARQKVRDADLAVIASPTFKATYSGLLKLFLDQFEGQSGMAGLTVIPLMLGAGEAHALAPDLLLKPVLVELGATCPTAGLYLLDSDYAEGARLQGWLQQWAAVARRSAEARESPS